jgi:hypothetical protein
VESNDRQACVAIVRPTPVSKAFRSSAGSVVVLRSAVRTAASGVTAVVHSGSEVGASLNAHREASSAGNSAVCNVRQDLPHDVLQSNQCLKLTPSRCALGRSLSTR